MHCLYAFILKPPLVCSLQFHPVSLPFLLHPYHGGRVADSPSRSRCCLLYPASAPLFHNSSVLNLFHGNHYRAMCLYCISCLFWRTMRLYKNLRSNITRAVLSISSRSFVHFLSATFNISPFTIILSVYDMPKSFSRTALDFRTLGER